MDDKLKQWREFEEECRSCNACVLRENAQNTVIYRGSLKASLMVIGEAPGETEDNTGYPFVGRSGKLLQNLLSAAGLSDDDYHICNIVKCRPPQNRRPKPEEIKTCKKLLAKQFLLIKPKYILLCGSTAFEGFFNVKPKMAEVRGQFIVKNGYKIMTTYHPAYALRNPANKIPMYDDVKILTDSMRKEGLIN